MQTDHGPTPTALRWQGWAMTDTVIVSRPTDKVAVLTLNRPDQLNAVNAELIAGMHGALAELGAERSVRAIVLTGAGRAFSAGVDLNGFGEPEGSEGLTGRRMGFAVQTEMSRLILRMRDTPQPVIAAVNGPAAGMGLALSLASDLRYAARSAVFRAAFMNLGLSNCDMGTSWLLPRLVGASRAHEMMLTMRKVGAEEAERIGLVAAVVDDGTVLDHAVGGPAHQAGHVERPRGSRTGGDRIRGPPTDHGVRTRNLPRSRGSLPGEAPRNLPRLTPPMPRLPTDQVPD